MWGRLETGVCPWHGSGGQAGSCCSQKGQLQKDPHPPPMWLPTPCRRYLWMRFCPKTIRTCLPSSSCISSDSWRYLWSSTAPFSSSLLLTTSTPLKRQVLHPVLSRRDPHAHSLQRWGLLCSHWLPLYNFRENWCGMVWQPAEPCKTAREASSVLREKCLPDGF